MRTGEAPTASELAREIGLVLQDATLSKARPYGVELIVAGADDDGAPALYHIDAAGGVTAWRAVAIGRGAASHMARLEEGFEAGGDLAAGKALAAKALAPEGKEPRAAAVAPAASMFVPSRRRRDT
uniref:Proteasome endopeptidase complex n=1 Tax=Phaeomonas parva TaxID=124430 RepID=A0A6U4GIS5_9STRA|mmetsp:Transcript_27093/g.85195  ORF Transcript_27093/g.85195 Transcript_27093/m.85195 type:complete len:126 (+) Transcript_27093:701-1078(+)